MIDYEYELKKELAEYERKGAYSTRIAGDTTSFRYPHMNDLSPSFRYDEKLKCFILDNQDDDTIAKMAIRDITVYELLNPIAKRLIYMIFLALKEHQEKSIKPFQVLENHF